MMGTYQPPLTITPKILNLVAKISEQLGRYDERENKAQALRLRRANQIRTIQGSLAIEGNSLSVEQITAVLEGKPVIAPPREVQEVKNALAVYERFEQFNALKEDDLLHAHQLLMLGLMDEAGRYRGGGVGVMSGQEVIHMAPPANQVPRLMKALFVWLKQTDHHPLIASAVFHYEFEFIHPFADGNGRMGRLWQSVILAKWNPIFANLPVESLVYQHQQAYYQAIALSTAQTDCAAFVEFMLETIANTFTQLINENRLGKRLGKELSDNQQAILHWVTLDNKITIKELAVQLRISTTAVENNIKKLRELALLERKGGRKDGFWQIRS
ncbi:Fic family protein [Marinospirillum insulare]|nr:Fic family protein [Marinospirillum insulare]